VLASSLRLSAEVLVLRFLATFAALSLVASPIDVLPRAHDQEPSKDANGPGANILSPVLCFSIRIPGHWQPGPNQGTYYSPDGKTFAEVFPLTEKDLKRGKGSTLVEKEASILQKVHEKAYKQRLADAKLVTFESAVPGTWKWTATRPAGKEAFQSPKRYLIDASPDGLIVINVQDTADDDELARAIIATLRRFSERPCALPRSTRDLLKP